MEKQDDVILKDKVNHGTQKESKGLRVSLMLTVGLMIVSFAAGMLTQKIVFRKPQTTRSDLH